MRLLLLSVTVSTKLTRAFFYWNPKYYSLSYYLLSRAGSGQILLVTGGFWTMNFLPIKAVSLFVSVIIPLYFLGSGPFSPPLRCVSRALMVVQACLYS